jgi:DNA topoisomerase VI subunit B
MCRVIWFVPLFDLWAREEGLTVKREKKNHMLFEVLKNSLRAVVEQHGIDCENYPPVKVIVAEGNEDITIKISDEGGGIPRSAVPLVWTFMFVSLAF